MILIFTSENLCKGLLCINGRYHLCIFTITTNRVIASLLKDGEESPDSEEQHTG